MDVFSHAVLPLAVYALLLRRPLPERVAAGLGAAMPDMDFFLSWVTRLDDGLFWFTHRGWSHTVWGAPLLALGGLAFWSHPAWARRWPRLAAFRLTPLTAAAALFGAWSHLLLDGLTITGVPALWPLTAARFTLNLYFFSVLFMAPVAGWVVWRMFRGRLAEPQLRRAALVLVAMLVVAGAVRGATRPPEPPGGVVQPTFLETLWVAAEPVPGGYRVAYRGWGLAPQPMVFTGNLTPDAEDAARQAMALGTFTGWAWSHPVWVVNASREGEAWRVEFRDPLALHRAATADWLRSSRSPEPLVVEVGPDGARTVQRPPAWGLG